jgi:hypothetical protein
MLSRGQQPTPGKLYMTWNVGPGAAAAIMAANPNTPIEQVLTRVWANKGANFINTALSNNPSMYRRGMTVGQVIANYERKMTGAMASTEGYITGSNMTTDEQARTMFTQLGIKGAEHLTARDAAEIFAKTNSEIGKQSAEDAKLARGVGILNREIVGDPYDSDNQSAVNETVAKYGLSNGIASGDPNSVMGAKFRVQAAGFIPTPDMNAFREAMNAGGTSEAKMMAYAALTDIATNNPVAYDASKMPDDERSRVKEYRAYIDSGMSSADAVKRIDEARTPEGKARREAMAKLFEGKKGELEQLSFADIQASEKFDKSMWSAPEAISDAQQGLAVEAYRKSYRFHRESGKDATEAKALAINELDRTWGTSQIDGTQRFMQYPPEKSYRPVGGSYDWLTTQARNTAVAQLSEAGLLKSKTVERVLGKGVIAKETVSPEEQFKDVELRLVPRAETAADVRSNKPPRYELWYRKPDGSTDVIPGRWFTPNQTLAEQEYEAEQREKLKDRVKPLAPTGNFQLGRAFVR